jgi:hypothetical protein
VAAVVKVYGVGVRDSLKERGVGGQGVAQGIVGIGQAAYAVAIFGVAELFKVVYAVVKQRGVGCLGGVSLYGKVCRCEECGADDKCPGEYCFKVSHTLRRA